MKNEAKQVKKTSAFKYAIKKAILFYGIPTAVICLPIYYFLSKADMAVSALSGDVFLSVLITCFICQLTYIPGLKGDIKKGVVEAPESLSRPLFGFIPKNMVLQCLVLSIFSMLIFGFLPTGFLTFFGVETIPGNLYWIVKSLYSGVFVAFHIYHATGLYFSKL